MSRHPLTRLDLDPATSQLLGRLAAKWGISKEEAVRRALEHVDAQIQEVNKENRLEVLRELQRKLALTPAQTAAWQAQVRDARR